MNSIKKTNNILGLAVGLIASIVYLMTMESTVSLWDCGEFISCAYKLEVSHSPGAPFFSILARIWIILFGDNPETVATAVNSLSAVASGLTVMFLFWTITHFGKKMLGSEESDDPKGAEWLVWGAGLVGAFAFCFSDTFWFSAVEGEVYALSSFIMAFVFWAMLKWESVADKPHADRWILLISLVMGISIGVHLLNLLTIPALVLIYYFRKSSKVTLKGGLGALGVGAVLLGLVQYGIILYLPKLAFKFDIFAVNEIGLPFNSGSILFFLLLIAGLYYGYTYSNKKGKYYIKLAVWCVAFLLIGYSSYVSMVIRSKANTPINMGAPDTAPRLISFLAREQFGNVPLLTGPYYTAYKNGGIIGAKDLGPDYFMGEKNYEYIDNKREYKFSPEATKFFPRAWDGNSQPHVDFYNRFLDKVPGEDITAGDNLRFFIQHQFIHMYWRYFMWNYAGRANDYQGRIYGEPKDSPWITGIPFIDNMRVGNLDKLPDAYSKSKARNNLYMLPFLLGILGLIIQYNRNKQDFYTILTLFFFTGIAIMLFVNNTPDQPRERDYSYVGSTYAFAIWIGLGVFAVANFLKQYITKKQLGTSAIVATVLCFLLVPVIMANAEWDDHDRSKKSIGTSVAYNYLMACAPNAILFTEGDNDTYPLWFAQEVLGYRRDVRIVNLSLLSIAWYVDQLNYKINDAPAVKMVWKPDDYISSRRDMVYMVQNPPAEAVNLKDAMDFCLNERNGRETQGGGKVYFWPGRKMKIPVDKAAVAKNKIVPADLQDKIVDEIVWDIGKDRLMKNDLTVLNIITANMFDRPIYFSTTIRPENFQGLENYLLQEGSILRFSPVYNPIASKNNPGTLNVDKTYDMLMNKYTFGGADNPSVYFDEPNRRALTNFRAGYAKIAKKLCEAGDTTKAIKALNHIQKEISTVVLPNDLSTLWLTEAYYVAGDKAGAKKLALSQMDDMVKLSQYMKTLNARKQSFVMSDLTFGVQVASQLMSWANYYGDPETVEEINKLLQGVNMSFPQAFPQQQPQQQPQQAAPNPAAVKL